MKPGTVYIQPEGRQFGLEVRVMLKRQLGSVQRWDDPELRLRLAAAVWTFPVLRTRLWALRHGYGWPQVLRG